MLISFHLSRRISFTTPAPERARLDACMPKDAACNFITDQGRSDVVHDLLAFLAERMLEMNKQKLAGRSELPGWPQHKAPFVWGAYSHCQGPREQYLLNYKIEGTFRLVPAFAPKSPETNKKETPSKHNPRKRENQTLPKIHQPRHSRVSKPARR